MADKGKIIVINNGEGGIVENKKGEQYKFTQPNHVALCLNAGDIVKFDLAVIKDGMEPVALNVERLTAGTIVAVDAMGLGTLEENKTLKRVNFYQPFPIETGVKIGDLVRYSLVSTDKGELAVNLTGIGE